jgi:hypothetical protein
LLLCIENGEISRPIATIRVVLGATKLLPVSNGHVAFVVNNDSVTTQNFSDAALKPNSLAIIRLPQAVQKSGA